MEMACVLWVLITTGDGVCVGWVLISHGDGVCVGWLLVGNEDVGVCWTATEAATEIPLHGQWPTK